MLGALWRKRSASELLHELTVTDQYHGLVLQELDRCGVDPHVVTVDVRQIGAAQDGLEVYAAMVHLTKWDQSSAVRLLLGLPLIEQKIRETARASWLASGHHFVGLWVHASKQLSLPAELKRTISELAPDVYLRDRLAIAKQSAERRRAAEECPRGDLMTKLKSLSSDGWWQD